MVKNLSYNSKKLRRYDGSCWKTPFSDGRFKLRGIGSNKLVITDTSKIVELLRLDNNISIAILK